MYIFPPDHDFEVTARTARSLIEQNAGLSIQELVSEITESTSQALGLPSSSIAVQTAVNPVRVSMEFIDANPSKSQADVANHAKKTLIQNEIDNPTTESQIHDLVNSTFGSIIRSVIELRRHEELQGNVGNAQIENLKNQVETAMIKEIEQTAHEFYPDNKGLLARAKQDVSNLVSELMDDPIENLETMAACGALEGKDDLYELSSIKIKTYRDMALNAPLITQDLKGRIERKRDVEASSAEIISSSPKMN